MSPGRPPPDIAILTVIQAELDAACRALGIADNNDSREKVEDGTIYQHATIESALRRRPYRAVLGCIGGAGNPGAGVAAQAMLSRFHPRALFLMGIAAGVRGKVRIGDVVFSDRIVAYEPAALVRTKDGAHEVHARPEIDRTPHTIIQDIHFYRHDPARTAPRFSAIGGKFPAPPPRKKKEYRSHVADRISVQLGTIASGEKLLRDPDKLLTIRRDMHGKVEVGEMEAAGVVEACRRAGVPWLVVRGISDFGDELKDDRFHELASRTAAVVLVDFMSHGLDLGGSTTGDQAAAGPVSVPPITAEEPTTTIAARSPVHNVPLRRAQNFHGRDHDLSRLVSLLTPGRAVRLAASVEGLAGVGKTELALRLVDHLEATGRFPGGIFWFEADDSDLRRAWGGVVADDLGLAPGPLDERAAAAVRHVSGNLPALIVLDNVETWTRDTEPHPLPRGAHVALLVTTRHAFLAGANFSHYPLDFLAPEAARDLLLTLAGRDLSTQPGFDDLLQFLGGHALAVELAGAYLHEFPEVTPHAYRARRASGRPVEDRVRDLVRYEGTVRDAFDATWERLDDGARQAARIAAQFAPEEASDALLEACGVGEESRHALRRRHLMTGAAGRWRMHRLVREYALSAGSAGQIEQARQSFVAGCAEYSNQIELADGFRIYRADGPHLESALAQAAQVLGEGDSRVSRLLDRMGTALHALGDLPRARDLLELALASDLRNLGEGHPSVFTRRSNLALVLQDLGDLPHARDLLELALASDLKNLGEGHPSVATRRSNLALVLKALGDLPRARDLLELALASDLKNLGEGHPSVSTRRSNLALVLKDLGDLPRARDLLELALASDLKNLGEGHPSVATRRSNLALVFHALGDLPRARDLLELALTSDLKNLGEGHPSVSTSRSNLAAVLHALGDLPRARDLLELALASDLKNLGEGHPSVSTRRSNLAAVLQDLGDLPRARDLLELAFASALKNLGEGHPSVSTSRSNLAMVLKDLGDLPRARDLLELALASDLKNLGEGHPSVSTTRSNLALVLQDLGDLPRARDLLELALASDLKNLGEGHPSVATRRFNLASICEQERDLATAREHLRLALTVEERSLGPDNPSTAFTRVRLAEILGHLGEADPARAEANRALAAVAAQPAGSAYRVAVERIARQILESSK